MTTFIGWDFEKRIARRYRRVGECNQCGDCCRNVIHVQTTRPNDRLRANPENRDSKGEPINWPAEWMEPEHDNPERYLWQYVTTSEIKGCPMLEIRNNLGFCAVQQEKPGACTVFPTHPDDIRILPRCSYSFEVIQEWTLPDDRHD